MEQTDVRVVSVTDAGPDAVALELETPPGFEARPGQFVRLTDPDGESRFYSISSPWTDGSFEVTVEVDPEGTVGPWLAGLGNGTAVPVAGPYGDTFYESEPRAVVLAGGPGVGPAVGIAERALAEGNEAAVVYLDDGVLHEHRLSAAAAAGAQVYALEDAATLAGATNAVLTGAPGEQVFVYGFADFLEAALDALAAAGADPALAKTENFG